MVIKRGAGGGCKAREIPQKSGVTVDDRNNLQIDANSLRQRDDGRETMEVMRARLVANGQLVPKVRKRSPM